MRSLHPFDLFPVPVLRGYDDFGGTLHQRPKACVECRDQPCRSAPVGEVGLCSRGYGYLRVDTSVTIVGVVLRSFHSASKAYTKVRRNSKSEEQLTVHQVRSLGKKLSSWKADDLAAIEAERTEQLAVVRDSVTPEFIAANLAEEIRLAFGQIHDYQAFATQIQQNISALLERRYPGRRVEEKLAEAEHEVVAIYWAASMMLTKLEALYFLQDPEAIKRRGIHGTTRLHGLVLKYVRIYERAFDAKKVKVSIGTSYTHLECNVTALELIVQGLVDNALKYSPSNSLVTIDFQEVDYELVFSVSSYGPRIGDDEYDKIFEPFYRGRNAKAQNLGGSGVGLGLVHMAASQLGARAEVEQDLSDALAGHYRTTFKVRFDQDHV